MKIVIEGNVKEVADLISEVQGQRKRITAMVDLYPNPKGILRESINSVLHEKSHGTNEEKSS